MGRSGEINILRKSIVVEKMKANIHWLKNGDEVRDMFWDFVDTSLQRVSLVFTEIRQHVQRMQIYQQMTLPSQFESARQVEADFTQFQSISAK